MADTAGDIRNRIRNWSTKQSGAVPDEEIWSIMNEIMDDVTSKYNPWFCKTNGSVTRDSTAANNFLQSEHIPRPRNGGSYMTQPDFTGGTEPDNVEYLRAMPFPTGLIRPLQVFYGEFEDNVKLKAKQYEPFIKDYPLGGDGGSDPAYYTTYGETFLLGPTPPFDLTLSVFGTYKPDDITSDADSNVYITHAEELLLFGALDMMVEYGFEEDARGGLFNRRYRDALNTISSRSLTTQLQARKAYSRRAGSGRWSNG